MKNFFLNLTAAPLFVVIKSMSHHFPVLSGFLLSKVWFRVSKIKPHLKRDAWVNSSEQIRVNSSNNSINVFSQGPSTAAPVVLVHGWSGRWDQMIEIAEELLLNGFRVVAFDLPAHGVNSGTETDFFELSAALSETCKALNLQNPSFVCHSAGFLTLSHAVLERRLKFKYLVTIAAPSNVNYLISKLQKQIGFPDTFKSQIWKFIQRRVKVKNIQEQLDTGRLNHLANSRILVIHDTLDRQIHVSESSQLRALWPKCFMMTTEGLGHNRILASKKVVHRISHFLSRNLSESYRADHVIT